MRTPSDSLGALRHGLLRTPPLSEQLIIALLGVSLVLGALWRLHWLPAAQHSERLNGGLLGQIDVQAFVPATYNGPPLRVAVAPHPTGEPLSHPLAGFRPLRQFDIDMVDRAAGNVRHVPGIIVELKAALQPGDAADGDVSRLRLLHYETSRSQWEDTHAAVRDGSLTATVTSLSPFAIGFFDPALQPSDTTPATGATSSGLQPASGAPPALGGASQASGATGASGNGRVSGPGSLPGTSSAAGQAPGNATSSAAGQAPGSATSFALGQADGNSTSSVGPASSSGLASSPSLLSPGEADPSLSTSAPDDTTSSSSDASAAAPADPSLGTATPDAAISAAGSSPPAGARPIASSPPSVIQPAPPPSTPPGGGSSSGGSPSPPPVTVVSITTPGSGSALLSRSAFVPGDSWQADLLVRNAGSTSFSYSFSVVPSVRSALDASLQLAVSRCLPGFVSCGAPIYQGPLLVDGQPMGTLSAPSDDYLRLDVSLAAGDNSLQGLTSVADLVWTAIQAS